MATDVFVKDFKKLPGPQNRRAAEAPSAPLARAGDVGSGVERAVVAVDAAFAGVIPVVKNNGGETLGW
jgi:hypothetical protein